MDSDRTKKASEWYWTNLFRDEAIRPRPVRPAEQLPPLLRTARSLEQGPVNAWQSRESIFLKQARLLAAYEDDYAFDAPVVRYFPTYQALTDQELRGYFAWRTGLRRGDLRKTSLSFAFLYIYELLNQVGITDPMEGYAKLREFREGYGALDGSILGYLDRWLADYVVYYGLDPNLLGDSPQVLFDRSLTILENIQDQPPTKAVWAVKQLSPRWLARSRFYAAHPDDCDAVIHRVLVRVSDHYAARCKRGFVEQYFGPVREYQVRLFDTAVFCDPLKILHAEFAVDERCVYRCRNGLWTVRKHPIPPKPNAKLGALLKTIDAVMRREFDYGHPIKAELETKWIMKIIQEEARALAAEKQAAQAKKITIDFSSLDRIRRDAAVTREKLIVEEEPEEERPECIEAPAPPAENDSPLDDAEYRLMQCLLYGRDIAWVQAEGRLLSVLLDGINDKLYDTFLDTVAEDGPSIVEDYIDELKEMIHP